MVKRNILVTGGAGFIGSHLVNRLIDMGHQVTVLDNLKTGSASNIHNQADFIEVDLHNQNDFLKIPSDIDKIFVIGKSILETYKFVKKSKRGKILNTINDFSSLIKNYINNNDLVMIKGSNATGLNMFSKKLKKGQIN